MLRAGPSEEITHLGVASYAGQRIGDDLYRARLEQQRRVPADLG